MKYYRYYGQTKSPGKPEHVTEKVTPEGIATNPQEFSPSRFLSHFESTHVRVLKANLKYPKVTTFLMQEEGTTVFPMNGFRQSVNWKNTAIRLTRGNHLAPKIERKSFLWPQEKRHFTFKEAMIKKKKEEEKEAMITSVQFQVYLRHRIRDPTNWAIKQHSINFKQLKFLTIIQLI